MGQHLHAARMRFGDDGAIDVRLELRDVPVSIVHPDLHEAHAARAQLLDVIASLLFRSRAVRNAQAGFTGRTADRRGGDPLPHGQEAGGIRDHLVTQLVRQFLIGLEPHAQCGRDAVVGVPLQLVDEVFAPVVRLAVAPVLFVDEPDMVVTVDERRHHASCLTGPREWRPAAADAGPACPTQANASPSTRNAAFSIGALPSPTMSRAPSNQMARAASTLGDRVQPGHEHGKQTARNDSSGCGHLRRVSLARSRRMVRQKGKGRTRLPESALSSAPPSLEPRAQSPEPASPQKSTCTADPGVSRRRDGRRGQPRATRHEPEVVVRDSVDVQQVEDVDPDLRACRARTGESSRRACRCCCCRAPHIVAGGIRFTETVAAPERGRPSGCGPAAIHALVAT